MSSHLNLNAPHNNATDSEIEGVTDGNEHACVGYIEINPADNSANR
ncbi:MAG: hypothetical protein V7641_1621 [Blastocatellia bacterium]